MTNLTPPLSVDKELPIVERAVHDARTTLVKTATSSFGSDQLTIDKVWFDSVVRNLDIAIATFGMSGQSPASPEDELRAALAPFAAFADPHNRVPPSKHITNGNSLAKRQLTMADCYKAAAALARAGQSPTGDA